MHDVLLLGAGASYGARKGLTDPPPPLGRGLAQYLLQWLDANDPDRPGVEWWKTLEHTADPTIVGAEPWRNKKLLAEVRTELQAVVAKDRETDAPHFEALMDRWVKEPLRRGGYRDHLEFTQRLLSYSMNLGQRCAFIERPDRFDELLGSFKPSVIVTVNYDLLVEQALARRSMRHCHPGIPGPAAGDTFRELVSEGTGPIVPMFKLHGSVDWLPVRTGAAGVDEKIVQAHADANPMTPRTNAVDPADRKGAIISYDSKHTFEPEGSINLRFELDRWDYVPVVGVYGQGKPLLRNLQHVRDHREACSKLLAESGVGSVLAVGIRPVSKDDDPTVYGLTRWLGKNAVNKLYASPTVEHCKEFEAMGFRALPVGLGEYLERQAAAPSLKGEQGGG